MNCSLYIFFSQSLPGKTIRPLWNYDLHSFFVLVVPLSKITNELNLIFIKGRGLNSKTWPMLGACCPSDCLNIKFPFESLTITLPLYHQHTSSNNINPATDHFKHSRKFPELSLSASQLTCPLHTNCNKLKHLVIMQASGTSHLKHSRKFPPLSLTLLLSTDLPSPHCCRFCWHRLEIDPGLWCNFYLPSSSLILFNWSTF